MMVVTTEAEVLRGARGQGSVIIIVIITPPLLPQQLHRVSAEQRLSLEHLDPVGQIGHV